MRKRLNSLFASSWRHIRADEFTADVNRTSFCCCFTSWVCPWWVPGWLSPWRRHRKKKTRACDCGSRWWRCSPISPLPFKFSARDEQAGGGGRSAGDGPHTSQPLGNVISLPASWTQVPVHVDWLPRQQHQCSWLQREQIRKPPLCCVCDEEAAQQALTVVLHTRGVTMVTKSSRFKDCNYNNHYRIIVFIFFFTNIVRHVCPTLTLLHPPSPLLLLSALHDTHRLANIQALCSVSVQVDQTDCRSEWASFGYWPSLKADRHQGTSQLLRGRGCMRFVPRPTLNVFQNLTAKITDVFRNWFGGGNWMGSAETTLRSSSMAAVSLQL